MGNNNSESNYFFARHKQRTWTVKESSGNNRTFELQKYHFEAQNDLTPGNQIDSNRKKWLYGNRFAQIWKVPKHIIESKR
jgi:hypothetical protein